MPQTKNEIAKALYKQGVRASANTIAQTAESLGFGNKIDYSDEEVAAIAAEISKSKESEAEQPQQQTQTAQPPLDRDAAALLYRQEQERSTTDAIALIEATRGALERKQSERQQVLEQLTDWDTYLDDPIAFLADFAQLKSRKLANNKARVEELLQTSKAYQAPIVWDSPQYAIAPSSIAGCLPM